MTETSTDAQEKADLLGTLATHRSFLRQTVKGLSDEQARQRTTVSVLCLGGLVKHVTVVERNWANFIVQGPSALGQGDQASMEAHAAGFQMLAGETLAGLLEAYAEAARGTDELVASLPSLDVSLPLPPAPWFEPGARSVRPPGVAARPGRDGPARRSRRHHPGIPRRGQNHGLIPSAGEARYGSSP